MQVWESQGPATLTFTHNDTDYDYLGAVVEDDPLVCFMKSIIIIINILIIQCILASSSLLLMMIAGLSFFAT